MMQSSLSTSNFKLYIRRLLALLILAIVLMISIDFYNRLTYIDTGADEWYGFYHYVEKNSIDVVAIGSSHIYQGVNPVLLWKDYGIAGYDFSVGALPIWYSYAYLQEVLKTQTPKVVLLDVYMIPETFDSSIGDSQKAESTMISLKPSWSKYKILRETNPDNWMDVLWTFPITHTKYKTDPQEHKFDIVHKSRDLGYGYHDVVTDFTSFYYCPENCKSIVPCEIEAEKYLRKCIELCQKKGANIILVNSPTTDINDTKQGCYNYIQQIADEYEIEFINGCCYIEDIGINYTTDIEDSSGHMNHSGVNKFTKWLAENILSKYEVPVHSKEDKSYDLWNISVRNQHLEELGTRIKESNSKDEILQILDGESDVISIYFESSTNSFVINNQGKESLLNCDEIVENVLYIDEDTFIYGFNGDAKYLQRVNGSYIEFDGGTRKAFCVYSVLQHRIIRFVVVDEDGTIIEDYK